MNYQVLLTEMLQGTLMTLRIFFSTLVFALPLGLLVSLGRMSKIKIINWPVRLFILIMRGTPLMLQLLFVFYGLKPLFGIQLDRGNRGAGGVRLELRRLFCRNLPRRHRIHPPMASMRRQRFSALTKSRPFSESFCLRWSSGLFRRWATSLLPW